ncbi:hypothetical protein ACA910_000564 [Epithemia clementina (nom. ined.)]
MVEELVRSVLFYNVLERAQSHCICGENNNVELLSLLDTAVLVVGASHRNLADLIKIAFIFKILELCQLLYGRTLADNKVLSGVSIVNLVTGTAMRPIICPRQMLFPDNETCTEVESTVRANASDDIKHGAVFERSLTWGSQSSEELLSITEGGNEDKCEDVNALNHEKELIVRPILKDKRSTNRVLFAAADIFIFDLIIGDNPSVLSGPPVQLDWKHCAILENVPLNDCLIDDAKVYPLHVRRMNANERLNILLSYGLGKAEIKIAANLAAKSHRHRCTTIQQMANQQQHEQRENVKLWLSCRKRTQERLLQKLYDSILSAPEDMMATQAKNLTGEQDHDDSERRYLCRVCAKQNLEDTSRATMTMYHRQADCPLQKGQ